MENNKKDEIQYYNPNVPEFPKMYELAMGGSRHAKHGYLYLLIVVILAIVALICFGCGVVSIDDIASFMR